MTRPKGPEPMTDRPLTVNGVRLTPETIIKTREHFAEIDRRCFADDLRLGEIVIPCAVLQDGTRVLSERGISKALGRTRSGSHWQKKREQGAELPLYLTAGNIKPFISNELIMAPCRLLRQRRQARRVWHNPAYGLAQKDYTKRKIGLDS